jgi:hypothetical protein
VAPRFDKLSVTPIVAPVFFSSVTLSLSKGDAGPRHQRSTILNAHLRRFA